MSKQWQAVNTFVSNLTGQTFEPQTRVTKYRFVSASLSVEGIACFDALVIDREEVAVCFFSCDMTSLGKIHMMMMMKTSGSRVEHVAALPTGPKKMGFIDVAFNTIKRAVQNIKRGRCYRLTAYPAF